MENQHAKYKKDIEKTIHDRMVVMREVVVRKLILSSFLNSQICPSQKIARRIEAEQQEIIMNGLEACQVESDSEYLDIKSEDMMVEINEALAAFNDANHEFKSAKEVSKAKLNESKDRLRDASEEVQELFRTLENVGNSPLDELCVH